jgi:hemerythrin-like domain-containing protein
MQPHHETPAVVETRVVHDSQRRATSLLVDVVSQPGAPAEAVLELRDYVVAALQHHHESEDHDLWPRLRAAAPHLAGGLDALSDEHEHLDAALGRLRSAPVDQPADANAVAAALAVRDLVHEHLAHEEPLLFPALSGHLSDGEWDEFSQQTVASAPHVGLDLLVEMLYESGSDDDVDLILRHLPPAARDAIPDRRRLARSTLAALRASSGAVR